MKVFYICGYANDVFYVRANDADAAEELLLDEVGKYIFQRKLKDDDADTETPETLGDNIIVEFGVHRDILKAELVVEDITASAFIFSENRLPHWEDWKIEVKDVVGNSHVAESIQEMLTLNEKEEDDV